MTLAQIGVILVVAASIMVGPVVAYGIAVGRKRRARARRRSPIGIELLRPPGHTLREQIEDLQLDVLIWAMLTALVPATAIALLLAQHQVAGRTVSIDQAVAYGVAVVLGLAWLGVRIHRSGTHLDRLRAGLDAEMAVGQELDRLMRRGAHVFHDLPGDQFNIDHVVAAREGVFVVETKGYTKPNRGQGKADSTVTYDGKRLSFPTFTTDDPLSQAERQARWLAGWLGSATGESVATVPVLALPGWFVNRQGRGAVRVFSGRELGGLLDGARATPVPPEQLQRIAHQLEQRCRSVTPSYRAEPAS